jgi:hypothetical protein
MILAARYIPQSLTPGMDVNEFKKRIRPREDLDDVKDRWRLEQSDRSISGPLRDVTPESIKSSNESNSVRKYGMLQLPGMR